MTTKTIHIDENNKSAQAFLNYVTTLDFVKIEEKANAFEQKIIDQANKANEAIKNGQIISSKELREKSNQW
jgi:hypothetical protein